MTKSPILAKIDGTDIPYEPDSKSIKNMTKFLKSIKSPILEPSELFEGPNSSLRRTYDEATSTIKPSKRKAKEFELRQPLEQVHKKGFYKELIGVDESKPVSDYDLKYKHNLNLTQRVLYRFLFKLGKNPSPIVSDKLKIKKVKCNN